MRIVVLGAGGVGGYFGGRLAHAGTDVTFFARGATLEALRTRGLRVDSIKGDIEIAKVNATDDASSIGKADAVLVCVKSWQVRDACASIRDAVGEETIVVPLESVTLASVTAMLGRTSDNQDLCIAQRITLVAGDASCGSDGYVPVPDRSGYVPIVVGPQ